MAQLPAKRQRIADPVEIINDMAKESFDWFPPLKPALGGVAALTKHYEVLSKWMAVVRAQLTQAVAGIRKCQGEDRRSSASARQPQTQHYHSND